MQPCQFEKCPNPIYPADGEVCILHSRQERKDPELFVKLLYSQISPRQFFDHIWFPIDFDFWEFIRKTDQNKALSFRMTRFYSPISLGQGFRPKQCKFEGAQFFGEVEFERSLLNSAEFLSCQFWDKVAFRNVEFIDGVAIKHCIFHMPLTFKGSRFVKSTVTAPDFVFENFPREGVTEGPGGRIAGPQIDFQNVRVIPPEALYFIDADLGNCLFEGTNLRNTHFTNVRFHRLEKRICLVEEASLRNSKRATKGIPIDAYSHLEETYRDLKCNFEENKDFERAGHFHFGEKEMRRLDPATPKSHRALLTAYFLLSGYGERMLRPAIWFLLIWILGTVLNMRCGVRINSSMGEALSISSVEHWTEMLAYCLSTMFLLRPAEFLMGPIARSVHTLQGILGPLLAGLFALAVRQRLRR